MSLKMKPEVLIVLGNELVDGRLSKLAIDRLDKAAKLYSKNKTPIILAGGYNIKHPKGIGPTEAAAMRDFISARGVSPDNIILEEDSRDTHANAYFTKKIIQKMGWKNIIVITSDVYVDKSSYFFDFIYGGGYNIEFVGVPTDFSEEERKRIVKYEKASRDTMRLQVYPENSAIRGDNKKIKEIIDKFYARFEKGEVGLPKVN